MLVNAEALHEPERQACASERQAKLGLQVQTLPCNLSKKASSPCLLLAACKAGRRAAAAAAAAALNTALRPLGHRNSQDCMLVNIL